MTTTTRTGSLGLQAPASRHPAVDALRRIVITPVGAVSLAVIVALVFIAVFATWIAPYSFRLPSADTFQGPSSVHFLGTDNIGRDTLSRLIQGARVSIYVGFLTVGFGTLVGACVGLTSGFIGGTADLIIQRFVDSIQAIPALILTMAIISVIGPSTTNAVLAIAVFVAASNSRVVRGAVFAVKENVYLEAAEVIGASPLRRMVRHVLPNVMPPILILISAGFGSAIIIESALSFLGLATQRPDVSWGMMLRDGRAFMESQPGVMLSAGTVIAITVLAFNMLGDVVRDVLDPRLRGSR
ncbi:MAG: ABC transporter permease [Chloroflexi bacterium]|nr:ABC transporter permease [Chloroflexota bacterium]